MLDQKAKDVGRLIGQSPEYQAVKRANEALHNDRDAVTSLNRMETLRQEAQRLIAQGKEPSD
ncbi:MAG TPA: YlbF family regulator, partial [Gemmatimonadaceae bacterium]